MKNQRKKKKEVTAPKGKAAERKSVCVRVLCEESVLCVCGKRELHSTCTRHKKIKTTENYCKSKSCLFHFISYTTVIARSDASVMWYIANSFDGVNGLVPLNL